MKKLIALIVAVCMLPVTGAMADDTPQLKLLTDTWYTYGTDDFENLDINEGDTLWDVDGWTPQAKPKNKTMDSTLQKDPLDAENKVMRIKRTAKNTSANERIYKSFNHEGQVIKATGDIRVGFRFLEDDALNKNLAFSLKTSSSSGDYGGGAPGDRLVYLYFGGGKVREDSGNIVASYVQDGSWISVDIILNTNLKKFDLYINGNKANGAPLAFFKTDSEPMDISRICFNIDRSIDVLTTKYIDDINIYLQTPPPENKQLKTLGDTWYDWDTDVFDDMALTVPTEDSVWGTDGWTPQSRPNPRTMDAKLWEDPKDASNMVMQLQRTSKNTSANERIYKSFERNKKVIKATGDVKASFRFLETDGAEKNLAFSLKTSSSSGDYGGGAPGDRLVYLYFGGGKVREDSGNIVASYVQDGSWISVDIILNTNLKKFDLYINGNKANGAPLAFFKTDSEPMDISRICFNIDRGIDVLTTKYIDDIKLSLLTKPEDETPPDEDEKTSFLPGQHVYDFMDFEKATGKDLGKSVEGWDNWTLSTILVEPTLASTIIIDPDDLTGNSYKERNKLLQLHRLERNTTTNEHAWYILKDGLYTRKLTGKINLTFRVKPVNFPSGSFNFGLRNSYSNSVQLGEYMFRIDVNSSGDIYYATENGDMKLAEKAFPTSGWSDVRLEVDTEQRAGWLYVNGERIGTDPLRYYVLGTEDKWNHISIVQFDINRFSKDQNKVYFDDIAVWKDCTPEVKGASDELAWENISTDTIDGVRHNLSLPESIGEDFRITWSSSDENAIKSDGTVICRSYTQKVTLTADIVYDDGAEVYQNAHTKKKFDITVLPQMNVDKAKLVQDIANIYLTADKFTDEPVSAITKDLKLPTDGPDGAVIEWSTGGSPYITDSGVVSRPDYSQGDAEVSLKATVSIDDGNGTIVQAEKEFLLTVKRQLSDEEKVAAAKDAVVWENMSYESQDEPVTQNLVLPTKGLYDVDITWQSSNQRVMTPGGVLKRREEDKAVTLTAAFSLGTAADTKNFDFVVKISPEAMAQIEANDIIIQNADAVTDNFTLPLTGSHYGLTIKWSSSNTAYAKVKNGGSIIITRPEYADGDKNITLTAKFLVEGGSVLINFPITVKALLSDTDMVQSVYDALTWESISLDTYDNVFRNLSLLTDFGNGVKCVWSSSNENVLLPTGEVINPNAGESDCSITLKARIQKNNTYLEKIFDNITVKAFSSDEEKMKKAAATLIFSAFHDEAIDNVTKDISLPTVWKYATTISWSSSGDGAAVINSSTGSSAKVCRADFGKGDKTAQLKAIITDGKISKEKTFYITVKEAAEYSNLFVHDYEWADVGTYEFKKENDSNEWSFPDTTNVDMLIETDPLDSSNQVFMMRRRAGLSPTGNGQMYFRSEKGQLGELTMSGRFFMNDVCSTYLYAEGLTGTGSQIQIYFNTDGTVKFVGALDEETQSVTVTKEPYYTRGKWVNFRVEMNTESQKYHVFIINDDGTEVCITANGRLVNEQSGTDFDSTKGIGFIYTFDKTRTRDIKGYRFTLEASVVSEDSIVCVDNMRIDYRESHSETLTEAAINFEKELLGKTDLANVTQDIAFPTPSMGETIKISSSNPKALDKNGKVTPGEQDEKVILTVEFLYDDRKLVKTYEVTVKSLSAAIKTDADAVAADLKYAVDTLNSINLNSVTENLPFVQGRYGSVISYTSDNEQIIAADGSVTRPKGDTPVTVTITAEKNSERLSQSITVIVKGIGSNAATPPSGGSSSIVYIPSAGKGSKTGNNSSVEGTIPFTDVLKDHWAYEYILNLYREGCINGKTRTLFSPDEPVLREEFVKMVCEFFNLKNSSQDVSFTDVDKTAWYYKYICSAKYFGISNGIGDGSFGIGEIITRQDAATIIYRIAMLRQLELKKAHSAVEFSDSSEISDYAKEAVSVLSSADILAGNTNGCFEPNVAATRAQAAKILNSFR